LAGEPVQEERARGCVFLLTDYGLTDEFAGVLKAVLAKRAPAVPIVDLTHGVPRFDVRAGALALERTVHHLGPGVILAVVDPGVGGSRRPVALEVQSGGDSPGYLVGPDNGLLLWGAKALGAVSKAVAITTSADRKSSTFDGRDLFAPAAAALWQGCPLDEIGTFINVADLVSLVPPVLTVRQGPGDARPTLETEILWIDTFGNVQLSAEPRHADEAGLTETVEVIGPDDRNVAIARRTDAFVDLDDGELGLITDANGHLALVGNRTSAALTVGISDGQCVTLVGLPGRAVPSKPGEPN
jgi:S-adenosyl-L-methionine hydrolase (adenosine-forming)